MLKNSVIKTSVRLKLISGALALLILALAFNALLSSTSLEKLYLESMVSQYNAIGKELQQYTENYLYSGDDISKFSEMSMVLAATKKMITRQIRGAGNVSVSVALPDGSVKYSTDKSLLGKILLKHADINYKNISKPFYARYENSYITTLPLRREKRQKAAIVIAFGEKQVNDLHDMLFDRNLRMILIIIACCLVLLIISDGMIFNTASTREFPKQKISITIFLIIILSQVIFSGLNINMLKNHYQQISSTQVVFQDVIMDSGTVLVISMFFIVEMLILFFQYIEREFEDHEQGDTVHPEAIRPAAFFLLFGANISISFLPLHMESLYEPILNLSRDTVIGLPVSVRMLTTGISFFIAGIWFDRRGWHEPFLTGLALAGAGIFCSALAMNGLQLIIFQGILGMGYGLSLMSAQGFVVLYMGKTKAQGIARLGAGTLAGHISGAAAGAMLAERIGYRPVFFAGAVIVLFVIVYTSLFMRSMIRKPEQPDQGQPVGQPAGQPAKGRHVFKFLFNRNICTLLLFSIVPTYIAMIGFLDYFCPVYLSRLGVSQSAIGRVFMIDGFCLIYIAPLISKYIDASGDKKTYIVIGGILGGLAFITFYFAEGLAAAAVAALFLGLSGSFSIAAQTAYVMELRITQEFGEGKALGILRSLGRSGQVIGPIMFSWLIVTMEIGKSMTYIGVVYLFITVLFMFISQNERKTVKNEAA